MAYRGRIKNGVVVFEGAIPLAEGTEVRVDAVSLEESDDDTNQMPSIHERLKPLIGTIKGLPPDASKNLDQYLYGSPEE